MLWRTRSGDYALIQKNDGRWGVVLDKDQKFIAAGYWDKDFNYPDHPELDLMNRLGSTEEKGWPEWCYRLVGSAAL